MEIHPLHDWNLDYGAARALQDRLRPEIKHRPLRKRLSRVAGADIAVDKRGGRAFAVVVVLAFPSLDVIERRTAVVPLTFPYIPGLLTFREGPALIACFEQVENVPDVVLVDGQGIAHPRRLGLGAHLGLWLRLPTIGCAKSRLIGEFDDPGQERGAFTPLRDGGEEIGAVVRTRSRVKPLFVSPGHLVDVESSVRITLECGAGFRLPEPTRLGHQFVTRLKRDTIAGVAGEGKDR